MFYKEKMTMVASKLQVSFYKYVNTLLATCGLFLETKHDM